MSSSANMAKNKEPLRVGLEEEPQGTNIISNEPKQISDQDNEIRSGHCDIPLLNVIIETDSSVSSVFEASFVWPSLEYDKCRCIYRVPSRLRKVNPDAYTPQMLLIGPLFKEHQLDELSKHSLRYLDYMELEEHKKKYLNNFVLQFGNQTVEEFRSIIKKDEQYIRACYAKSTDWINSENFIKMMLHDSVFILVVFWCQFKNLHNNVKRGDFLMDEPCHGVTILEDLILLENQLPYTLLEKLFEPFFKNLGVQYTFRDIITLGFEKKIKPEVKFLHLTDLYRAVRVGSLGLPNEKIDPKKTLISLHNATDLHSIVGVKFKPFKEEEDERETSLVITFKDGILKMPCFFVEDDTERILRNIMALEQCHYPWTTYVCNYINFLDFLIDSKQDVDFLINKGVIKNWLGNSKSVAEMVNNLCLGIVDSGSNYYDIAQALNHYYKSFLNKSVATLERVYFKDLWTGSATITAVVVVVLTLIGTVASVLQVMQKDDN